MDGAEIPGFYYGICAHLNISSIHLLQYWQRYRKDAEKRKYFRVLANHVAPEGSKYSRQNVKKEKEQSKVGAVCISIISSFV